MVKADEIDVRAAPVLGGLEQIDHAREARLPRELGRDVRELICWMESTSISPALVR